MRKLIIIVGIILLSSEAQAFFLKGGSTPGTGILIQPLTTEDGVTGLTTEDGVTALTVE